MDEAASVKNNHPKADDFCEENGLLVIDI